MRSTFTVKVTVISVSISSFKVFLNKMALYASNYNTVKHIKALQGIIR